MMAWVSDAFVVLRGWIAAWPGALAFVGGIATTLTGALIGHTLTTRREHNKQIAERRFEIYMRLIELKSLYFWFTTAEFHREQVSDDIRQRAHDLTWKLSDMLRAADQIEYLNEIMDVMFSPSFSTAVERDEAMGKVIDRLGDLVNPRYAKRIKTYGTENALRAVAGHHGSNAPGAPRAFWGRSLP